MKTNIGITEKDEQFIANKLNTLLADEYVLITKTRNYHWHITGPSFLELHKFYEGHYTEILGIIDGVAERVRQIGQKACGTLKEFLEKTRLKEGPYLHNQSKQTAQLLKDHETICKHLRDDIAAIDEKDCDPSTVDMLTGYLEFHEKTAWMLRSYQE